MDMLKTREIVMKTGAAHSFRVRAIGASPLSIAIERAGGA